jgi:hypothetical protein
MKLNSLIVVSFALASIFSACQDKAPAQAEPAEDATAQDAAAQTPAAAKEAEIFVPAVDWNVLEGLIPKTAAGMPRTNQPEDRSGLGDLGFSHALGIYEKGDRRVEVQILDSGGKKLILSTVAAWYAAENVEETSSTSMEKTTTIQGFTAIERMDKKENTAEVSVVLKDRFIVMVVGQNIALTELRKVVDAMDLKKIAGLG